MLRSAFKKKLWLLLLFILFTATVNLFGAKPSNLIISNPIYSNGSPAKTGDTITVSITFESDISTGLEALVYDLTPICLDPKLILSISKLTGNTYQASGNFRVKAGATDGDTSASVYVTNSSKETINSRVTFRVNNNFPPEMAGTPAVTVTRGESAPEASTLVMAGDKVTITLKTKENDTKTVNVDLSDFNLGTVQANSTDQINYTCEFTVPTGLANGNKTIRYEIIDNTNLTASYNSNPATVLTLTAVSGFSSITIENTSGNNPVLPGDSITFTIRISNYKNNIIRIDSNESLIKTALGLPKIIGPNGSPTTNSPAEYVYTTPALPKTAGCTFTNPSFIIQNLMVLNVESETTAVLNKTLDLGEFDIVTAKVSCTDKNGNPSSVASISSVLTFSVSIKNTSVGGTSNVTVDLTPLGVDTPLVLTTVDNSTYTGTYTITTDNPIDGNSVSFVVTAKNHNDITLTKVTNAITIDNVGPIINDFTITGATGTNGTVKYNDRLTMKANVTNINGGSVFMDFSMLDSTGIKNFTNTSGNNWQLKPTVGRGNIDDDFDFVVVARDSKGNEAQSTITLSVDNEPPILMFQSETKNIQQNPPYIIIGDQLTASVGLGNYNDDITVQLDLTSLNGDETYGIKDMTNMGGGKYSLTFDIATGTLNRGATFPLIIIDDAGNTPVGLFYNPITSASFTFPLLDQNPPDPGEPIMQIINMDSTTRDDLPTTINSWKKVIFDLPYTKEAGFDDSATASVDITYLNKTDDIMYLDPAGLPYNVTLLPAGTKSDIASMTKLTSKYTLTVLATESPDIMPVKDYYKFLITMSDLSGNKVAKETSIVNEIDLVPPEITNVTVSGATGAGGVYKTGDTITFRVEVTGNDDRTPYIKNLSNITSNEDILNEQFMDYSSPGVYTYSVKITEGNLNKDNASWTIRVYDQANNFDEVNTPVVVVDNLGLTINSFSVTSDSITSNGRINYSDRNAVTFFIEASEPMGELTLDLSVIGYNTPIKLNSLGSSYNYTVYPKLTNASYTNYQFTVEVTDDVGNSQTKTSEIIPIIDCQVPTFLSAGSEIGARSASLPSPTDPSIIRAGDSLTIFASLTAYIDAVVESELEIGVNASSTLTMTYNPDKNRHEATYVIEPEGVNNWENINSKIHYAVRATDLANNVATPSYGLTTHKVENYVPELAGFSLTIAPSYEPTNVVSIGSGTSIKYLVASVTLKDDRLIKNASLDFSEIPGAPANFPLASITKNVANTKINEIDLRPYPTDDFYDSPLRVTLNLSDTAGYSVATTAMVYVDTKPIEVTGAYFNGQDLFVDFSEEIKTGSFKDSQWAIIGSTTNGLTDSINLGDANLIEDKMITGNSLTITLTLEGQRKFVSWADNKPIYLKATNNTEASVTDRASNWIKNISAYPIIITDSSIKEEPAINSIELTHNWPTSISLKLTFTQEMDESSFVASEGVLFVDLPNGITSINDVSYDSWYVFQKTDNYRWDDNKTLTITLSESGKDWIATNLTNNTDKVLKFAQYQGKRMVKNVFNKGLKAYTPNNPVVISDNRLDNLLPTLNVLSSPKPVVNLASACITISFNEKVKLFTNSFVTANETEPLLGYPVPTDIKGSSAHIGKISLFNLQNDSSISLTCKSIKSKYNDFASTTVTINLTDDDVNRILEFYNNYETIYWGLQIEADAFYCMWNTPNSKYKPTSPGTVEVIEITPTQSAKIIACSVSDMPPAKEDVENFTFEFELEKSKAGIIDLPFMTKESPKAYIYEKSTGDIIAEASLTQWSTRNVKNKERSIATFKLDGGFVKQVDGVEAELRLTNLKDVFGNLNPTLVASCVYDLNKKSESTDTGFTTASTTFIVDNVAPEVTSVTPSLIGLTNINAELVKVEFSENIDTGVKPVVTIATTTETIRCNFLRWENTSKTAVYSINQAITENTQNGTWDYNISGCYDLAGNSLENTKKEVVIKSKRPLINAETLTLYTIRKNIDINKIVTNKPFSFEASDYVKLSFQYINSATENTPHRANFYNTAGTLIGSSPIAQIGINATATLNPANFTQIPTTNSRINVKVMDIAGNETDVIGSLNYFADAPAITGYSLTETASHTVYAYYYSPYMAENDMQFRAVLNGYNGDLTLLLASYSVPMSSVATMTLDSNQQGLTLTSQFGKSLSENTFLLYIADEAGNLLRGTPQLVIVTDNTPPTLVNVIPGPTEEVANKAVGMATFTVVFNEIMDTTLQPNLSIATATQRIAMNFAGWGSDGMTASYTNAEAITSAMPAGTYRYLITGAKDITGNEMLSTPATCTTTIWPAGPAISALTIYTMQPDIGNGIYVNRGYNPSKYATAYGYDAASVTFKIDYINTPTYTPHSLEVFDESDNIKMSLPVTTVGKTGTANQTASIIAVLLEDGTYYFKTKDALGNYYPEESYLTQTFVIDREEPDITSVTLNDGGIGQTVDGLRFYSPSVPATFTVTTGETKDLVLLIASGTATDSFIIPASNSYSLRVDDKISASWHDNIIKLIVADTAGNINEDTDASITIKIDSIPPEVLFAGAVDEFDSPLATVGKEAKFIVKFDSEMNQNYKPTVCLATDTALGTTEIATLTFDSWIDSTACSYRTNGIFDSLSYPVGTSAVIIKDARDLAGNLVAEGSYGEVEVISKSPSYYATLTSRQTMISDRELTNMPLSLKAEPGEAVINLLYLKGPYATNHDMLVYDSDGNQIATHTLADGATSITVNTAFFGTKDVTNYVGTFSVKLRDAMGNLSNNAETSLGVPFVLNYDGVKPNVASLSITGISTGSTPLAVYYNPSVTGNISLDAVYAENDSCRLVIWGVSSSPYELIATRTFDMTLTNNLTYSYKGDLSDIYGQPLPEGTYIAQFADDAGNFTTDYRNLIIDKTPPSVVVATVTNGLYISSGEAGLATFSIQFNETLFENAYQYLEIATESYKIPCRLVKLKTTVLTNDTAIFETDVYVSNSIRQGEYRYHVTATDLTGNVSVNDVGGVLVKSAGPLVSSMKACTYQATTASDTLASGNEYHYDDMFSFDVAPNTATLSIKLAEEPDGDPSKIFLTFSKEVKEGGFKKEIILASHSLAVSNLTATFTWNTSTAPAVATEAEYIIRVADVNNDLSAYSYKWAVDRVKPTYSTISFNSGVNFPSSGTVYLNPYRHPAFEVTFRGLNDHGPKLRVRSGISTDTYALTALSANTWKTTFRGKYSRVTNNSEELMPDDLYYLGLVDQAGNEASSGTADIYKLIIDTKSPAITKYNLSVNSVTVSEACAPSSANPLHISLDTIEPLNATGACYLDIYNAGQVRVRRLELSQSGPNLVADWNGKDDDGKTVADGKYSFKASDLCGNTSDNSVTITAITAPFQIMSPAVQLSSNTIKLWFNHSIEPSTVTSGVITGSPAMNISGISISDERALTFNVANMVHGTSYILTVASSLKNIYGSSIGSSNTAEFTADVKGPAIIGTNFDLVNNLGEIMVVFDQPLDRVTAEDPTSYTITDINGNIIPVSTAILQSDNSTVMVCINGTFTEKAKYTIKANGVKDELGNTACESAVIGFDFIGRDITPPEFKISAFSNPANENDIIVVVLSSEELAKTPSLTIKHGTAKPVSAVMQRNSGNNLAFMSAVSLNSHNGQTGSITVTGEDLNGNKGSKESSFVIATVSTRQSSKLSSFDNQFSLTFDKNSLTSDATVKILQREIEKNETASDTLRTSLQEEYSILNGLRASVTTQSEAVTNSELTPLTSAYEASIPAKKTNKGVIASLKVPGVASNSTQGIGLFYQKNGSWSFISSNITGDKEIKARITSSKVFAIMKDSVSPTIKLDDSMELTRAFETEWPEFVGYIKDFGSGVDTDSVEINIDGKSQALPIDDNGNFRFKPLKSLTNGNHELSIRACDRTGNLSTTGNMRFALVLPFEFKQIIQYPNPAKNYTFIRIRTNSTDIDCNVKVRIYDVAGHKVAEFDESDVIDRHDGNYEIRWDLTNLRGKRVGNGTYIAKIEATNPETGKRIKKTLKIAVLK